MAAAVFGNLKTLVSGNKRRFKEDGFDLDLTYISDRIIAMGFPADRIEGVFRNHIKDVSNFLESKHKGRYKLYNLCSERHYDSKHFQGRVAHFPFEDHNPPKIELIRPFCEDVRGWLESDGKNVVAIHCKAGKGRTGVMICAFLLHSGIVKTADEALQLYSSKRTHDMKGVTIPSQRRYVEYYELVKPGGLNYTEVYLKPSWISFSPLPLISGGNCAVILTVYREKEVVFRSENIDLKKASKGCFKYSFGDKAPVISGDVRIEFKHRGHHQLGRKSIFSFWFNTFFVKTPYSHPNENGQGDMVYGQEGAHADLSRQANGERVENLMLVLTKDKLDKAHKDKNHKIFPKEFKVEVCFATAESGSQTTSCGDQVRRSSRVSNRHLTDGTVPYNHNSINGQKNDTSESDSSTDTSSDEINELESDSTT